MLDLGEDILNSKFIPNNNNSKSNIQIRLEKLMKIQFNFSHQQIPKSTNEKWKRRNPHTMLRPKINYIWKFVIYDRNTNDNNDDDKIYQKEEWYEKWKIELCKIANFI
jgi:hypothetical protein